MQDRAAAPFIPDNIPVAEKPPGNINPASFNRGMTKHPGR
jgi:hypothetical protein